MYSQMYLSIKVEKNPNYEPSFKKKEAVLLKEDYTNAIEGFEFLTKGRFCIVDECGLSYYLADENDVFTDPETDNGKECEWCVVEAVVNDYECTDEDDIESILLDSPFVAVIKAKDLRKATWDDYRSFASKSNNME